MSLAKYTELYYITTRQAIDTTMLLQDFTDTRTSGDGDKFFERYGVGNAIGTIHMPFERMKAYEALLTALQQYSPEHYLSIHKGTAYYFLGWTAMQIDDFEKAVFYIDASLSEDLRLLGDGYNVNSTQRTPGISLWLLEESPHVAGDTAVKLRRAVEEELETFSNKSKLIFPKDLFVRKLVIESGLFADKTFRTIITSFYTFLLEFRSRQAELLIRSSEGGSIEPFLMHLLKGCLVLESLMKLMPPGESAKNLYGVVKLHRDKLAIDEGLLKSELTLEDVITLLESLNTENTTYQQRCFCIAYGLRNTAGHNLAWPDAFKNDGRTYKELYITVTGAIFWTIYHLWVRET